jgi:hypothetical protein
LKNGGFEQCSHAAAYLYLKIFRVCANSKQKTYFPVQKQLKQPKYLVLLAVLKYKLFLYLQKEGRFALATSMK